MKPVTIEEAVRAMQGNCLRPNPSGSISRVVIDSREVRPGDLFVAIRGERFDGHDFVGAALAAGALAAVVRHDFDPVPPAGTRNSTPIAPDAILIRVDDTIEALGRLGRYYRREIIGGSTTVVAVTGSNGKTTTKSMIAHILNGRWRGKASIKSFNNNIGVPLTLLSADPGESFLVCEVGMNAPGEIASLGHLIEPDVAVVTGVAEAHLEKLGSIERIAEEKLTLVTCLQPEGCAVLNADHEVVRRMLARDRRFKSVKRVTFGEWAEADLRLTDVRAETAAPQDTEADSGQAADTSAESHAGPHPGFSFEVNGRFRYWLPVPGRHNVFNALAAIGVARRFGMDHDEIAARLATFTLPSMRLEAHRAGAMTIINDAYNANPASMAAAIGVLADTPAPGRRVMIVGDMRELGAAAEDLHRACAERIAAAGFDLVIAVGEHARLVTETIAAKATGTEVHAYATTALCRNGLLMHLRPDDTVLVKGSRAMELEVLVEAMRTWGAEQAEPRRAAG